MGAPVLPEGQTCNPKPFMGLPYQDKQTLSYAKGLIITSCVGLGYFLFRVVVQAIAWGLEQFALGDITSVLIAMLLPMCAYYGARDRNEPLVGCLACCSGLSLVANALVLYVAIAFGFVAMIALTAPSVLLAAVTLYYSIQFCMALKSNMIIIVQTPADGCQVVLQTNTIPVVQTLPYNAQPVEQVKVY